MLANLLAKTGIAAIAGAVASYAKDLPVISISGSKFYDPEGNQFFMKGAQLSILVYSGHKSNIATQALLTSSSRMTH